MGVLPFTNQGAIYKYTPEVSVILHDPRMRRRVMLKRGHILNPTRIFRAQGGRGGVCELQHTTVAFGETDAADEDRLIGAIVQVTFDGEVVFAGTITGVQRRMTAGSEAVFYTARDLWGIVSEDVLYLETPAISSGGVLGLIRGGKYEIVTMSGGNVEVTTIEGPFIPTNHQGKPLVTISDNLVFAGAGSFPRVFSGDDVARVIEDMAIEQGVDVLDIEYAPLGSDHLGVIVGRSYDEENRSVVLGAPSETDFEDMQMLPFVNRISGTTSYEGCITQIDAYGGEITQSLFSKLVPAWNPALTADVIANPDLVGQFEARYGMVGRAWAFPTTSGSKGIVPFSDLPRPRQDEDVTLDFAIQRTDGYQVFATRAMKGEPVEDDAWEEVNVRSILTRYNKDMAFSNQINWRGLSSAFWNKNNFGILIFEKPVWDKVIETDGSNRVETLAFRNMYLQAMEVRGQAFYSTGHRGKWPRPKRRTIFNARWQKHLTSFFSEHPLNISRLIKKGNSVVPDPRELDGRIDSIRRFDNTGLMQFEADTLVEDASRPRNTTEMEIDGIDLSWRNGQTLVRIYDTDGRVSKDGLDWVVKQHEFDRGENVTNLYFDNELRYGIL